MKLAYIVPAAEGTRELLSFRCDRCDEVQAVEQRDPHVAET